MSGEKDGKIMNYKSFLIKYGEIGVKGKNKYMFEDALVRQIRLGLKEIDGKFTISKEMGRIYVDTEGEYDFDAVIDVLPVFLISSNSQSLHQYKRLTTLPESHLVLPS